MNVGLISLGRDHGEPAEKDRVGAGHRWEIPARQDLLTYLGQKVHRYEQGMQIHPQPIDAETCKLTFDSGRA